MPTWTSGPPSFFYHLSGSQRKQDTVIGGSGGSALAEFPPVEQKSDFNSVRKNNRGAGLRHLGTVALRFGNCNNGTNDGLRYLNVNNTAGNANWNIGAALFYLKRNNNPKQSCFLHR